MTGGQVKIDDIFPWIRDITDPDFNPANTVAKSFGAWYNRQITFKADEENTNYIYLAEHSMSAPDQFIWLRPWNTITFDLSDILAMNIFYASGNPADLLFVVCR